MEAVPRMCMLALEMKFSPEPTEFGPKLKQYIRDAYMEDPDRYNEEIKQLDQLRTNATNATRDFNGCSMLRKYYGQLHLLQSRFPMGEGGTVIVPFTWMDMYSEDYITLCDIRYEQAAILYNLGALHSILGAFDKRNSEEGMKVSCTHFQCAAGAFSYLRDHFGSHLSPDLAHDLLSMYISVMLGQAQECLLEKSMQDNRKSSLVARISQQVADYYTQALRSLDTSSVSSIMGSRKCKEWKKMLQTKNAHFSSISFMYMGNQVGEQQKFGERVTYMQASLDKHNEAMKLAKGQHETITEALKFSVDVIGGKYNAAKKDNDFVYHESVPTLDKMPEIKGASLVKALPFQPYDESVAGPDIFKKLVPMEAHEAASMYSEEKAKMLRQVAMEIDERNAQLDQYLTSLQLDQLKLQGKEPERLPQVLLEKCAAISVKPDSIKNLVAVMQELSNVVLDVDDGITQLNQIIAEEEKSEEEFQKDFGQRPTPMIVTDIKKELSRYEEGHIKASRSNEELRKAMLVHIGNLKLLAGPLDELQAAIPSQSFVETPEDKKIEETLQLLINKIEEMKNQRKILEKQLREQLNKDDITALLVTREDANMQELFKEEMKKHETVVSYIQQNLNAQDNILKAVTETNALYASTRKISSEVEQKREDMVQSLVTSYDAYDDLLQKSGKGIEFYKKLEAGVAKLLQRTKGVTKVHEEERQHFLSKIPKKAPPRPSAPKPASEPSRPVTGKQQTGLKLSDLIDPSMLGKGNIQAALADGSLYAKGGVGESVGMLPGIQQGGLYSTDSGQSMDSQTFPLGVPPHFVAGQSAVPGMPNQMIPAPGAQVPPSSVGQPLPGGMPGAHKMPSSGQIPSSAAPGFSSQQGVPPPVSYAAPSSRYPSATAHSAVEVPHSQGESQPSSLDSSPQHFPTHHQHSVPQVPGHIPQNYTPNTSYARQQPSDQNLSGFSSTVTSNPNQVEFSHPAAKGFPAEVSRSSTPPVPQQEPLTSNQPVYSTQSYSANTPGQTSYPPHQKFPQAAMPPNCPPDQRNIPASSTQGLPTQSASLPGHPVFNQPIAPDAVRSGTPPLTSQNIYPGNQSIGANSQSSGVNSSNAYQVYPQSSDTVNSLQTPISTPKQQHSGSQQHSGHDHGSQGHPAGSTPQQSGGQSWQQQSYPQGMQWQQPPGPQSFNQQTQQQQTNVPKPDVVPQSQSQQYSNQPQSSKHYSQSQSASNQHPVNTVFNQQPSYDPHQARFQQPQELQNYSQLPGRIPPHQGSTEGQTLQQPQGPVFQQNPQGSALQHPQQGSMSQQPQQGPVLHHTPQGTVLQQPSHDPALQQGSGKHTQQQRYTVQQPPHRPVPQQPSGPMMPEHHAGFQHQRQNIQQPQAPGFPQQSVSQSQPQQPQASRFPQQGAPQFQTQQPQASGFPQQNVSQFQPQQPQAPGFPQQGTPQFQTQQPQACGFPQQGGGHQSQTQQPQTQGFPQQGFPQSQPQPQAPGFPQQGVPQSQPQQSQTQSFPQQGFPQSQPQPQAPGFPQQGVPQSQPQQSPQHRPFQPVAIVRPSQQGSPQHISQPMTSQAYGQQQWQQPQQGQVQSQAHPQQQWPQTSQPQQHWDQSQQWSASTGQQQPPLQQQPSSQQPALQQQPSSQQPALQQQPSSQQPALQQQSSSQQQQQQYYGQPQQYQSPTHSAYQQQQSYVRQPQQSSYQPSGTQTLQQNTYPQQPQQFQQPLPHQGAYYQQSQSVPDFAKEQEKLPQPSIQPIKADSVPKPKTDLLSSSPDGPGHSSNQTPVLAPNSIQQDPILRTIEKPNQAVTPKTDPYENKEVLERFTEEVEKFDKYVESLSKHTLSGPTILDREWKELSDCQQKETKQYSISIARCYSMKNRYPDIMPFDHCRTTLSSSKDDYINASPLVGITPTAAPFIVTQAPLPVTFNDFWIMVYEQQISVIAMLLSDSEAGKTYHVYWPSERGQTMTCGTLLLNLQSVRTSTFCTERRINITHKEDRQSRSIIHLQFTGWPEHGVPDNPNGLITFITEVQNYYQVQRSLKIPIVVHCTGGIDRSAVFCLVYSAVTEILAGNGIVNIPKLIRYMRNQRKYMVQEKDQYKFCYDAVLFYCERQLAKRGIFLRKPATPGIDPQVHARNSFDFIMGTSSLQDIQSKISQMTVKPKPEITNDNQDMQQPVTYQNEELGHVTEITNQMVDIQSDHMMHTHLSRTNSQDSHSSHGNASFPPSPAHNPCSAQQLNPNLGRHDSLESLSSNSSLLSGTAQQLGTINETLQNQNGQSLVSEAPSTLLATLDPTTFTLNTSPKHQPRVSKASFDERKDSLGTEKDPADPLSLLDPLWTMKDKAK